VELKSAVIGLGETGGPLFEILSEYHDVDGIDLKDCRNPIPVNYEIINICIPYSDTFVQTVQDYQDLFNPKFTIIHSTVPIGTTRKIKNAFHSPILGRHANMKESILKFRKWIGGPDSIRVMDYFSYAGIKCVCVATSEETEALKLLCLAKYGMSIAFAQYCKDVSKKVGFSYADVIQWDLAYNEGVSWMLRRPILHPPDGPIKGHCVIPNTKILNQQHPNPILQEVLKYE
jgi:hypothetical protein